MDWRPMDIVIEGSRLYSVLGTCCQQWEMDEVTLRVRKTRLDLSYPLIKGGVFLKGQR